jgi:hypothetical protein
MTRSWRAIALTLRARRINSRGFRIGGPAHRNGSNSLSRRITSSLSVGADSNLVAELGHVVADGMSRESVRPAREVTASLLSCLIRPFGHLDTEADGAGQWKPRPRVHRALADPVHALAHAWPKSLEGGAPRGDQSFSQLNLRKVSQ